MWVGGVTTPKDRFGCSHSPEMTLLFVPAAKASRKIRLEIRAPMALILTVVSFRFTVFLVANVLVVIVVDAVVLIETCCRGFPRDWLVSWLV